MRSRKPGHGLHKKKDFGGSFISFSAERGQKNIPTVVIQ